MKTLKQWLLDNNIDIHHVNDRMQMMLDKKIVKEVRSTLMPWEDYLLELNNAKFVATNVYKFVVLENSIAVGLNENPSRGFTTPMVKYHGSILS